MVETEISNLLHWIYPRNFLDHFFAWILLKMDSISNLICCSIANLYIQAVTNQNSSFVVISILVKIFRILIKLLVLYNWNTHFFILYFLFFREVNYYHLAWKMILLLKFQNYLTSRSFSIEPFGFIHTVHKDFQFYHLFEQQFSSRHHKD